MAKEKRKETKKRDTGNILSFLVSFIFRETIIKILKENFEIILNRELEINTYESYIFLLKLNKNK